MSQCTLWDPGKDGDDRLDDIQGLHAFQIGWIKIPIVTYEGRRECLRNVIYLLYAPLTIPLVYCHIKSFQRASSLARPFQGGEKMTAVWASHHEELCSDGVVVPHVCAHMVVPHCWVVLDG
jgi:hypothetical protein